ncbi:ABC transporter substrate-binding protein [Methylobacterium brachythecii]|uniref:Iron complex transport system substrate-binding protein n=1 Tax=Methylobacterium brachythecii TaxID=1176177 RepID=A0A7W6AL27_9HYPH|nr:ABC transporter substrate-binding protein [Methylobacterium brachythecii]MBB3904588.1 iron complex transport system substrate-binding protein [Methylobacterium brachythecii]GLS45067.1 iron-hydroxamate transporter substrate-binding subunit [Methylobacterium brachythecii]
MIPSRRAFLAGSAALLTATGRAAADDQSARVVAVGWAGAQALLALGIAPLALPEIERYRSLVVEPAVPPETRELGLRSEPNLELMKRLAPHFIVNEGGVQVSRDTLERIAPVVDFQALAPGEKPLDVSRPSTVALAQRLCRDDVAQTYLAGWDARMASAAEKLAAYRGGPLCLVSDIFGNRALVFGANSLYQDVLDRVGIKNAFTGTTSIYGHATVGLDVLAGLAPDTRLCILSARVPNPELLMKYRPLWRALPMMRENRVTILSDILFYGGLPSADRFARLLVEKLPLGAS